MLEFDSNYQYCKYCTTCPLSFSSTFWSSIPTGMSQVEQMITMTGGVGPGEKLLQSVGLPCLCALLH